MTRRERAGRETHAVRFVGGLLTLTLVLFVVNARSGDDVHTQAPLHVSAVAASTEGVVLTLTRTNSGFLWNWISVSGSDSLASNGTWNLMNVEPWPEHAAHMQWLDPAAASAASRFYRVVLNADTDRDGLPDWWELLYFDDPTNAVSGADGDQDSWNNLQEYRRGGCPTNAWQADTNNLLNLNVLTPLR